MKHGVLFKRLLAGALAISSAVTMAVGTSFAATAEETEELRALKLEIQWKNEIPPGQLVASFSLNCMARSNEITVLEGDTLSYQVYIPSDGNYVYGMGGFDGQFDTTWGFLRSDISSDQNGKNNYAQLDTVGTDKWLTREFSLTNSVGKIFYHAGPSVLTGGTDLSAFAGKTSTIYYRNIKIKHSDGTETVCFGDSTGETVTGSVFDNDSNTTERTDSCTVTDSTYTFNKATSEPEPEVPFDPQDPTVPDSLGYATEMAVHFKPNATASEAAYENWYSFGDVAKYRPVVVKKGDKVSYEIFIPQDSAHFPGMGSIDLQTVNGSWPRLSGQEGITDQNGNAYGVDLAETYGTDKWIEVAYPLPDEMVNGDGIQHIGPRDTVSSEDLENLKNKTAYYYVKNLRIIRENGTEIWITPEENNLYSVIGGMAAVAVTRTREVNAEDMPKELEKKPAAPEHKNPDDIGHALKFEVEWLDGLKEKESTLLALASLGGPEVFDNIMIKNGDTLSYDVYLPSDGNPIVSLGSLDIQFQEPVGSQNNKSYWRELDPQDDEFINMSDHLYAYLAMDQWVTRTFEFEGLGNGTEARIENIGPMIWLGKAEWYDWFAGLTSTVYFRNIKITHEDGSEDIIFGADQPLGEWTKIDMENSTGALDMKLTELNRPANAPGTDDENKGDEGNKGPDNSGNGNTGNNGNNEDNTDNGNSNNEEKPAKTGVSDMFAVSALLFAGAMVLFATTLKRRRGQ